jgi:hypothetical protein
LPKSKHNQLIGEYIMSAFICTDKHFSAIAYYIGNIVNIHPQIIADKLKSINIESVNYRYNEKTPKRKCKLMHSGENYTVFDIIRLIECWHYQSCEDNNNLDFRMMYQYLISHFTDNQIELSNSQSHKWSI